MRPGRAALAAMTLLGLAGCTVYPEPVAVVPPVAPPIYAAPPPPYYRPPPPPAYRPPPPYYGARRYWVPRRCDGWGRCWGGFWRYG